MMRPGVLMISLLLLLTVACGGPGGQSRPSSENGAAATTTTSPGVGPTVPVRPSDPAADVETRQVWRGFSASSGSNPPLAAMAHGEIDVYATPDGSQPEMTLDATTILGTVTVLAVVTGPEEGRVEVMLPVRPNNSTGWVDVDEVSLYVADGEILIDLSARQLAYVVDGAEILRTDIGIGSDHNQTPEGHFFVTDSVTLADPNSPWGPHALGISARSETITEFNGGDGIIGIHGTNNPGSIGGNISLGCVRLPNDMITALFEMVPIGTRVTVEA